MEGGKNKKNLLALWLPFFTWTCPMAESHQRNQLPHIKTLSVLCLVIPLHVHV